jgi:hypothetical protein
MEPKQTVEMALVDFDNKRISADLAMKIAELILRSVHGDATFENQLPLTLKDGGDRWIIEGTAHRASSPDLEDPKGGYLTITLQKSNCRILDIARIMTAG